MTVAARLACDAATAAQLADALAETLGDAAVAAFEDAVGRWSVELHFAEPPNEAALRELVGAIAGEAAARALALETVAVRDWVAASLAGLEPVAAGRFVVHGAHDRGRVAANRVGIEIEAALAFGTGHHGTTRGCLLALDALLKRASRRTPALRTHGARAPSPRFCGGRVGVRGSIRKQMSRGDALSPAALRLRSRSDLSPQAGRGESHIRVLDIGTGTGVLAIAAAKALRAPVRASDIDARAVAVARANARANAVGTLVEIVHARGLDAARLRERGPYDLVFANILLAPLQRLAAPIARVLAPDARVVLSGLLATQAPAALAAYRAQGLALQARIPLDEWVTLVLAHRGLRRDDDATTAR